MRKLKFDNRQSIALQRDLGISLTAEQMKPMKIEGWLVGKYVCVQSPLRGGGWRVSLYPWGDKISLDFFTKDDAMEHAKEVNALGIDWAVIHTPENYVRSELYFSSLAKLIEIRDRYEAEGFFKTSS